jgi:serine/threonine-protein kinase
VSGPSARHPEVVGTYAICDEIATGGMATVHLGRLLGAEGFSRVVAVKKLHPQYAKDPEFITMFLDEARIVAPIRHPNVVQTLDILEGSEGLVIVMDYVHGETLARLVRAAKARGTRIPVPVACAIMANVCMGLHAAHEVRSPSGVALEIVHRDVSPQNVIVGTDGAARVLDFGVAKAEGRLAHTREGEIKGKIAYMAPEQLRGEVDRRTDIFACGIVLWELACGRRMFEGASDADILTRLMFAKLEPPDKYAPELPPALVACIMRALRERPSERYGSAKEFALAMESAVGLASPTEVGEWVESMASERLMTRAAIIADIEQATRGLAPRPLPQGSGLLESLSQMQPAKKNDLSVEIRLESDPPASATERIDTVPVPSAPRVPTVAGGATSGARPPLPASPPGTSSAVVVGPAAAQAPAPKSSRGLVIALVAMALLGALLLAVGILRRSSREPAQPIPTPVASSAAPPSTASAAPTPSPSSPPSAAASSPSGSASAQASAAPSTGPRPTATWTAPATAKPAKPSCDPPYVIDEKGHRHYKPECD